MVKNDKKRFNRFQNREDTKLVSKQIELTAGEYDRALKFVKEAKRNPPFYVLAGNNCVDFIQHAYEAAKGKDAGNFTSLYSEKELNIYGSTPTRFLAKLPEEEGGLSGVLDGSGNWVIPPAHKKVTYASPGFVAIEDTVTSNPNKLQLLRLTDGTPLDAPRFAAFTRMQDMSLITWTADSTRVSGWFTTVLRKDESVMMTLEGRSRLSRTDHCGRPLLFEYLREGKQLLRDTTGKLLTPFTFRKVTSQWDSNLLEVITEAGEKIYLDCDLQLTDPAEASENGRKVSSYRYAEDLQLLIQKAGNAYRHYLRIGDKEMELEGRFSNVLRVGHHGMIVLRHGPDYSDALLAADGEYILPPFRGGLGAYPPRLSSAAGLFVSMSKGYQDYIQPDGKLLFGGRYREVDRTTGLLYLVGSPEAAGVANHRGKEVFPPAAVTTMLKGNLIIRGGKLYYRDGKAVR